MKKRARTEPIKRFRKKVSLPEDADGCHQWIAYVIPNWGYGGFNPGGRSSMVPAHRWIYQYAFGPIPAGYQVHHTCENKLCVNPYHMRTLTPDEHNAIHGKQWAINKAKTHCKHGHPFDETNTYRPKGRNERHCRTCARLRRAAYRSSSLR